jgi:hypothetical protein
MKLTRDQISDVFLEEIEYQLTVMKQYLSKKETQAYLLLLERYGTLLERETVLERYRGAWGESI